MRVSLVNIIPQKSPANYLGFNQGLAYLSSVLKRERHIVRLFTVGFERQESIKSLFDFKPDIIFVYLTTNQYRFFERLIIEKLSKLQIPIFVGGPHSTCCPEDTLSVRGVSGVCIGEGEESVNLIIEKMCNKDSFEGIPNIWFKKDGEIIKNPTGYRIEDLDTLPFPDREIFPYKQMMAHKAIDIMGFEFSCSRGCIYNCRYCINRFLKKLNERTRYVRRRSVKNVIEEITNVIKKFNYRGIIGFHDDIFTLDYLWLDEFAFFYRKIIGLPFWCNSHINNLDEKIILSLRKAGCFRVHLGIECGNEVMRQNLLDKHISNNEIVKKVKMLKKHHIKIVTTFMIGLPGEDEKDINESISLCRDINPDWVLLSVFCPYPGTSIYEELVKTGMLDATFYKRLITDTFYSSKPIYPLTNLSKEKLNYYFSNFVKLS